MKYENADHIFPKELMIEIRKFMPEGYIYIASENCRKEWGSLSGQKVLLAERNKAIQIEYQQGKSVEEISQERYLSISSIYRILKQEIKN